VSYKEIASFIMAYKEFSQKETGAKEREGGDKANWGDTSP
jgi:hypothetical protein